MDQELAALASRNDWEHFVHPYADTAEDGQVVVHYSDLQPGERR